jgi:hypothetical protein
MSLVPRPRAGGEIGPDDALALREVLARQGFKDNRIVLAAPRNAILPAAMELPSKVNGAPIDQIVRLELSGSTTSRRDSFEMAYWGLKAAGGTKPVTHTLACLSARGGQRVLDSSKTPAFASWPWMCGERPSQGLRAPPAPGPPGYGDPGHRPTIRGPAVRVGRSLLYERPLDRPIWWN